MKVFCVRDVKSGLYTNPFFQKTIAEALRGFEMAVQDGQSIIGKFPSDFELLALADYNESSGKIDVVEPQFLARGSDFVKPSQTPIEKAAKLLQN